MYKASVIQDVIIMFRSSSVVEQPAVNRLVVGSSPTFGAIFLPFSYKGEGFPIFFSVHTNFL